MKLAIALQADATISRHFGRSSGFFVYDIDEDRILSRQDRKVADEGGHSALIAAIEDCDTMLCGGIGEHTADALRTRGINPLVTLDSDLAPDEAVRRLLIGTLSAGWIHACCCEHSR